MSQYISDEHGNQGQVATNSGWSEFCEWVAKLDAVKFLEVRHLCEQGWEQDLDDLAVEVQEAIDDLEPSADIIDIGESIVGFLDDGEDRELVMITNGIDDEDDDGTDG